MPGAGSFCRCTKFLRFEELQKKNESTFAPAKPGTILASMKKLALVMFCTAGFVLMTSSGAFAQQQGRFDDLVAQAVEQYSSGRYEKAIDTFKAAYAINEEPEILYNIARCYERLAQPESALEWYEKFIALPGTTVDLRTKALENIASLRREISILEAMRQGKKPPPEQPQDEVGQPSSGAISPPQDGAQESEPDSPMTPMKLAGWILVGAGGAGIVAGGIFGGLALSEKSKFDDAGFDKERLDYRDNIERNALIFDIGVFGGIGLAAVGAALLIIDSRKQGAEFETKVGWRSRTRKSGEAVSLAPSLIADGNNLGFGLQGRF
jgi:tetratricopeptide (TPR) repeat protein